MPKIKAGDRFPEFTFQTAYEGEFNSLEALNGKTVFWVLRYIGCTVCRYDVHLIAQRYDEFKEKEAQVFVVMQSDQQHVRKDLESTDTKLPFPIVTDPEQKIYQLLEIRPASSREEMIEGVLDRLKEKGAKAREAGFSHGDYEGNEQQLPAMFIVNEDGIVEYANYAKNIMDMPTVDEVLNLL
ncbi:MAG: redoxin domain-containing protein [Erysipelotrichaceae bacterium]|nr:redoxin domain-containing protein [Erysipelotrichaceae bacterium]